MESIKDYSKQIMDDMDFMGITVEDAARVYQHTESEIANCTKVWRG